LNKRHLHGRYKFLTVSIPKRLRNGRFASEKSVRRVSEAKNPCGGFRFQQIRWDFKKALETSYNL
jgi:hypothetical protein